jgi:hypothetical protein
MDPVPLAEIIGIVSISIAIYTIPTALLLARQFIRTP